MALKWLSIVVALHICIGMGRAIEEPENGWVREVSKLTNFALDTVVHSESQELDISSVDWNDQDSIIEFLKSPNTINYGIGYMVCLGLGLLLMLVVTLGGLITCCCRTCCSKKKDMEGKKDGCKRGCCTVFLFVFSSAVLLGCVCMFQMTYAVHDSLHSESNIFYSIADSLDNIDDYSESTLNELENVAKSSYNATSENVLTTLYGIPDGAVDTLENMTNVTVILDEFDIQIDSVLVALKTVNESLNTMSDLDVQNSQLSANISNLITDVNAALAGCNNITCDEVRSSISGLNTPINYKVGDTSQLDALSDASISIKSYIEDGRAQIESITDEVEKDLKTYIDDVETKLSEVDNSIDGFLSDANKELADFSMGETAADIRSIPEKESLDETWETILIVFLSLSSVLTVIVGFYFLGMLLGCCCPRAKPQSSSCCSRASGANCLLTGLILYFLLYWLIALVALVMFLVGGISHTVICRNLVAPNESSTINDIFDIIVDNNTFDVSISTVYTKCGENASIYNALNLESMEEFDLDKILDLSIIEEQFQGIIDDVNISLGNIDFPLQDVETSVDDLESAIVLTDALIQTVMEELSKNVTSESLTILAGELDRAAPHANSGTTVQELANTTRELQLLYVEPMTKANMELTDDLLRAQRQLQGVNFTSLFTSLEEANRALNSEGSQHVNTYIHTTAESLLHQVESDVASLKNEIENNTGRCYPLYDSYDTMMQAGCVTFLYAFNNLWFATVWCLVLLLPAIFMAFSLVDLYRKTVPYSRNQTAPFYSAYEGELGSSKRPESKPQPAYEMRGQRPSQGEPPPHYQEGPVYIDEPPVRYVTRPVYPSEEPGYYQRRQPMQARYM